MKLLVSLLAASRSESVASADLSLPNPINVDKIATCGADLSNAEVQFCQNKAAERGEQWSPPLCDADSACRAAVTDPCSYSCVAKDECDLVSQFVDDDKIYCNCVSHNDPPRFGMYWSCDNRPVNGTQHQFGFARVPGIHRENENDSRQVAILPMTLETDLTAVIASEGKLELFGGSPCVGTTNFGPDGLEFIEFSNLFNHDECQANCLIESNNGTITEICRTIIGFDDLFHSIPGTEQRVRLQAGQYWDFSCSRKLSDSVGDDGSVQDGNYGNGDGSGDDNVLVGSVNSNFKVELMCCDPSDPDCNQCYTETNRTHIMRIGPNADPKEMFFVDVSFEDQARDEYLHIEECSYKEYDENGVQLGNRINLIENGCDISGGLIKFKDRSVTLQNHDQFFLKPFQIEGQVANTFNINCQITTCRKDSNYANDGLCDLNDKCSNRYDVFNLKATHLPTEEPEYSDPMGRRRRDAEEPINVSVGGVHPCTYVSDGINVCIVEKGESASDENCWTEDKCLDANLRKLEPFNTGSAVAVSTLATSLILLPFS